MVKKEITDIIEYAIEQFTINDSELVRLNVSERAVMFHLARYMREMTPHEFHVDCEYNRHLTDVKKLHYLKNVLNIADNLDVYPDILIHKRNEDENNLLVVELKKLTQDASSDTRKLEAFKEKPYSYRFAAQIVFGELKGEVVIKYNLF